MTSKLLRGYCRTGAVLAATVVILSHCILLGTAAPAASPTTATTTSGSSPGNCMTGWLSSLGINSDNVSSYAAIFNREDVTEQTLRLLTLQDLEALGIDKLGHRALIHNSLRQEDAAILCENGGVCNPVSAEDSSFRCVCLDGFSGNSCENVTSCSQHVCLNGGTCVEQPVGGKVECQCPTDYSGERCDQDPCHSNPCKNGGVCSTFGGSYNCSCPIGYSGENCENTWLTERNYSAFKGLTTSRIGLLETLYLHLSSEMTTMEEDIKRASKEGKGPRFFSKWSSLEGSDAVQHMEHFTHSKNEYFIILYSNGSINTYSFAVSGNHPILQTLTVTDAASIVVFEMADVLYLAVAKNSTSRGSKSDIYQWDSSSEQFVHFSSLSTKGARDLAFISTQPGDYYLVFTCHHRAGYVYPSYVYKWVNGEFLIYQYLATYALAVNSVVTSSGDALLVLTHETENGNPTTVMYRWNGTYFDDRTEQKQVLPVASDETFTIGVQTFLAGRSLSDSSVVKIFSYNELSKQFVEYTKIDTPGAIDAVEYFHTNTEHFLVLTNFVQSQDSSLNGVPLNRLYDVLVYTIDGAGCELFQKVQTSFRPSVLQSFSKGECRGVALAGSSGTVELHSWSDTFNLCS